MSVYRHTSVCKTWTKMLTRSKKTFFSAETLLRSFFFVFVFIELLPELETAIFLLFALWHLLDAIFVAHFCCCCCCRFCCFFDRIDRKKCETTAASSASGNKFTWILRLQNDVFVYLDRVQNESSDGDTTEARMTDVDERFNNFIMRNKLI